MREIEVKILEIDKDSVIQKLESFGAEKVFDANIDQRYFDFPDECLESNGRMLRLRNKGDFSELTYKADLNKSGSAKNMEEVEVRVEDFDSMKQILELIGLENWLSYTKHRVSYKLGSVSFEIDKVGDIPPFLEIEAPTEKEVFEWVEKLGFDKKDAKDWSGKELMGHYRV